MANPNFIATYSSDEVYFGQNELLCITDVVNEKANLNHSHTEYVTANHSHSEYATQSDLDLLEDVVATKASIAHIHVDYADYNHVHDEYVEQTVFDTLSDEVDGKANVNHTHTEYATTTALNEVSSAVSGKANASHNHNDIYYTETEIDNKLADKANTSHNHTGVYDVSGAAANALTSANAYTDSKIDALVGEGASTTLDTIGEISAAIEDNQDAIDLLNSAIANKANASDLTSHTGNTTIHVTSTDKSNWNTAKTHADSAHAPSNAEKNQNAFSNVVVGSTTIAADTVTDTLTLVAGSNITLTPSAANDSVTIAATNTVYTHPTSAGNKHIPAGGSSGQILRWSADGTAVWGADNNTTYSAATQTANGLMSSTDKTKLDGIAANANNYTLPSAGTSLGGVKTGGDVTISAGVITVNDDSHNHVISNIDGLQSALDGKAASSHTHTIANITNLQSTLDGKASSTHTHSAVTTSANGLMIASDKAKLDGMVIATVSEVETYLAI